MGITAWVSVIVSTRHAGLRLESTLADLRAVHGYAEQRRLLAEGSLSEPAVALLGRLSRPATTEEKVLLAEVPVETVRAKVDPRLALVCF